MVGPTDNDPGSIIVSSGDVRSLRALLKIANDKSCAEATRVNSLGWGLPVT